MATAAAARPSAPTPRTVTRIRRMLLSSVRSERPQVVDLVCSVLAAHEGKSDLHSRLYRSKVDRRVDCEIHGHRWPLQGADRGMAEVDAVLASINTVHCSARLRSSGVSFV